MTDETQFDISDYEDVTACEVVIKHPVTGAPTDLVITVAGPEHPDRRRINFERQRQMRKALQRTGKLQLADPVEDEDADTEMLVACTLGWRGMMLGGVPLEFSKEQVRRVYTDAKRRWLRDQVKTAMEEREAFIARSARN